MFRFLSFVFGACVYRSVRPILPPLPKYPLLRPAPPTNPEAPPAPSQTAAPPFGVRRFIAGFCGQKNSQWRKVAMNPHHKAAINRRSPRASRASWFGTQLPGGHGHRRQRRPHDADPVLPARKMHARRAVRGRNARQTRRSARSWPTWSKVRLPLDARIRRRGQASRASQARGLYGNEGACPAWRSSTSPNKDSDYYGQVVSVFPFLNDRVYTADQVREILDLPPGTLTQRTMIYAVRTHPERPGQHQRPVPPGLGRRSGKRRGSIRPGSGAKDTISGRPASIGSTPGCRTG